MLQLQLCEVMHEPCIADIGRQQHPVQLQLLAKHYQQQTQDKLSLVLRTVCCLLQQLEGEFSLLVLLSNNARDTVDLS